MAKRTPLYECHLAAGAKMVDFYGWDMPLHYGSQLHEHHQVREAAGLFDVSHMTVIDFTGDQVATFLKRALANNVDRLTPGKALYSCMLNKQGGVIDDLITYKLSDNFYRVIVNSATHDKDLAWFAELADDLDVHIKERIDVAMLALQGPKVRDKLANILNSVQWDVVHPLKPFHAVEIENWFFACTGYTGEDGFEIILPADEAAGLWQAIMQANIQPCGLGARDTLRLEAGLNLYGADMDETVTPLESNLAWTVAWEPKDRKFVGRDVLEKQLQSGPAQRMVGLVLEGQGVLRNHQKVIVDGIGEGEITSGSFSPSLNKGIALARVPAGIGEKCWVEIRGKKIPAQVIKPPFVRHGKKTF